MKDLKLIFNNDTFDLLMLILNIMIHIKFLDYITGYIDESDF